MFQDLPIAPEPQDSESQQPHGSPVAQPLDGSGTQDFYPPAAPPGPDAGPPYGPSAPTDRVSVAAFVLSLLGAVVVAIPLAVWGLVRTQRPGPHRGRGFAIVALCISAAWAVASVVLLTSGLIVRPAATARSGGQSSLPTSSITTSTPTSQPRSSPPPSASLAPPVAAAPKPTGPLSKPTRVYWERLKRGMCVRFPQQTTTYYVTVVDCRAAHDEEVIARTALAGPRKWPGDTAATDAAEAKCRPRFAAYIGIGFDDSRLEMDYVFTEPAGWNTGDRTLICLVLDPDDAHLTKMLRGSRQ